MSETTGAASPPAKRFKDGSIAALASSIVDMYPDSDLEVALDFCRQNDVGDFVKESNDRLLKVGRNVRSLITMKTTVTSSGDGGDDISTISNVDEMVEAGLQHQVEECRLISRASVGTISLKVPKVRFGKTDIDMPILTLGCMRFQQKWGPDISKMNQVYTDCQDNLVAILRQALAYGINHIETARGYGCSELQLGVALKQLMMAGEVKREDLIIQTKVPPKENPDEFREAMELSFKNLQVDYIDLFAFHGLNGDWQWPWMFEGETNCWSVIEEYRAAGKIRYIGFSTHGPTDLINRFIETDKFDYSNVHHHFCGSYTASGDGPGHIGNISCLRKMKERNMGAFIISPCDKGGKIYSPSNKLRSLTLPDCEPMAFGLSWLWNLDKHDEEKADAHTMTIGAARPSDLDQVAVAAYLQGQGVMMEKVTNISGRLLKAQVEALGQDWLDSCYEGTVKAHRSKYLVEHNQVVWIYNCIKAWGMLEFSRDRFRTFVNNQEKYDPNLPTDDERIDKIGRGGWGFTPGITPDATKDYFVDDLSGVPEKNRTRMKEVYEFISRYCTPEPNKEKEGNKSDEQGAAPAPVEIPNEYLTSYEMKVWPDYPDRKYPY
mmetsp:Transcript_35452/g.85786  ORF Transcript_35452/g.85786 Transcript_35452/m.85786 type:complete len:605 (-) Transcript_35452:81-1895(-)